MRIRPKIILLILFAFVFHKSSAIPVNSRYMKPAFSQCWNNANEVLRIDESRMLVIDTFKKSFGILVDTRTITAVSSAMFLEIISYYQ